MKILCIGDSNTYGYDPRSYFGSRYPEDVRWTGRIAAALAKTGIDGPGSEEPGAGCSVTVVNAGMNGMTVARARSTFLNRARIEAPDLVIVMLGTNDILVGYDIEETADRMDDFVREIKEMEVKVLLIAPPLLQLGEWVPNEGLVEESRALAELYKDVAADNDCYFANAAEWDIDLTFDGVHFSQEGHEAFAQELLESIAALELV